MPDKIRDLLPEGSYPKKLVVTFASDLGDVFYLQADCANDGAPQVLLSTAPNVKMAFEDGTSDNLGQIIERLLEIWKSEFE